MDIFEFWQTVPADASEHPADAKVLRSVKHGFRLECLPGPYKGRLRTAEVVLLFLSPGFTEEYDIDHAQKPEGQRYYFQSRTGNHDLPSFEEHTKSAEWSQRVLRQFRLDYEAARSKVAFLNIAPYKSKSFDDWHMLSALPSSRVALNWAQKVLFPEAEEGRRVVVCMRSASYWGLGKEPRYGVSLFAPAVTRRGDMLHEKEGVELATRADVVQAVRNKLGNEISN